MNSIKEKKLQEQQLRKEPLSIYEKTMKFKERLDQKKSQIIEEKQKHFNDWQDKRSKSRTPIRSKANKIHQSPSKQEKIYKHTSFYDMPMKVETPLNDDSQVNTSSNINYKVLVGSETISHRAVKQSA